MRLRGRPDLGHLTYCTNIHAGESLPDLMAGLREHVPAVKASVAPDRPLGLGLRIAEMASRSLAEPGAMEQLEAFLADGGYYVFTINGFPFGTFHGARVKEQVYAPDWSSEDRLAYTNRLADQLARLLPDGIDGTISTVPGTFKPWADPERVDQVTRNLLRHAAYLALVRERTDRVIQLALEPEPYCFLETIEETVRYFEDRLFSTAAVAAFAAETGYSTTEAEAALRLHLGVCYDVCHAAVEFEDPLASLAALERAGIGIGKLQISSALRLPKVTAASAAQLAPFNEPVYLHQVVEARGDRLVRHLDLPEALARIDDALGAEWRVHFHVPIFLAELKDFSTTQAFLADILAIHRERPFTRHLEVETYTWDVLPDRYRGVPVADAVARELSWAMERLTQ